MCGVRQTTSSTDNKINANVVHFDDDMRSSDECMGQKCTFAGKFMPARAETTCNVSIGCAVDELYE